MGHQQGFTYLGLLFAVAIAGVALAATGILWSTERQREKERELLAIGREFRDAIASYYENAPGNAKRYPAKLEELLKDMRFLGVRRHLRRIYVDPMTGTTAWGLVMAPEGGIVGVYSTSERIPIKIGNFDASCTDCAGKAHYAEWKFVYTPATDNRASPIPKLTSFAGEIEHAGGQRTNPLSGL